MASHTIQQAADEGSRAAIEGLDESERLSLARQAATKVISSGGAISARLVSVAAASADGYYTVTITYRAKDDSMSIGPMPLPSDLITRKSVIQLPAV